jgi:Bacterial capsule synthesis protein PGA_cap
VDLMNGRWSVLALAAFAMLAAAAVSIEPAGELAPPGQAGAPTAQPAHPTAQSEHSTMLAVASPEPASAPEVRSTPDVTPQPAPEPRRLSLVATGDILLHERLWTQARRDGGGSGPSDLDFTPQIAAIEPIVDGADLAICHLETPLAPEGGPYEGYPLFSAPPQIVLALAETGYDACTTASNHTFDQGAAGIDRTLSLLEDAGVAHAGSARAEAEADEPTLIDVNADAGPVTVGLLSYTYGFNGVPYPGGDEWRGNLIDEDEIVAEAATARDAGADVVVLALHWGTEYVHEPTKQQLDLAPRLTGSADVDLVLGHHAHVVQPIEAVDGTWVVYGMGNLMHAQNRPNDPRHEGLLVRFTLTEDLATGGFSTTAAEYLPLYQTYDFPVGVVDVAAALDGGDTGTANTAQLERAMERTTEIVGRRGAFGDGLELLAD